MSKYAYVVSACTKYTPELCALLNSLCYVGNKFNVHVFWCSRDGNRDFIDQFKNLSYNVILHEVSQKEIEESRGITEVTCRKRYWYAAEVGLMYEAVCILDADLVFVRNPWQYFEIAAKTGFILGPTKEQNKVYDHDHHLVNGEWVWSVPRGFYNDKDLCNCPVFIDAKKWNDALRMSWYVFINGGFKAPDMDAMSLSFLQFDGYDQIVKLAGLQWLGTNEQHLKPYIRVVERNGKINTENGLEVFCYHGQYYKEKWRDCQLDNRHNCAAGYIKATENCDAMARGAMDLLYSYFKKMLGWKIQIDNKNYVDIF